MYHFSILFILSVDVSNFQFKFAKVPEIQRPSSLKSIAAPFSTKAFTITSFRQRYRGLPWLAHPKQTAGNEFTPDICYLSSFVVIPLSVSRGFLRLPFLHDAPGDTKCIYTNMFAVNTHLALGCWRCLFEVFQS